MNRIYIVTRKIKHPDMFVAESDEKAIEHANLLGPRELFFVGETELPVGYLGEVTSLKRDHKLTPIAL